MAGRHGKGTLTPYYDEVIAAQKKHDTQALRLLVQITDAIEKSDVVAMRRGVAEVVELDPGTYFGTVPLDSMHVVDLSVSFYVNLLTRVACFDEWKSFNKIYNWWAPARFERRSKAWRVESIWTDIVNLVTSQSFAFALPRQKAVDSRFIILRRITYGFLRAHEDKEIKKDVSRSLFADNGIDLVTAIQENFQVRLDQVTGEIDQVRSNSKRLKELRSRYNEISMIFLNSEVGRWLGEQNIETTKVKDARKRHYYVDFFRNISSRKIPLLEYSYYTEQDEWLAEPRVTKIRLVFEQRRRQIQFLEFLYDVGQYVPHQALTDMRSTMKRAIALLGTKSNLHSNDTLVALLHHVFVQEGASRVSSKIKSGGSKPTVEKALLDAWEICVHILSSYFALFSEHSKYNIRDKGPSYLGMRFPRSIAGRFLHDCGVYAVRFAYILGRFSQLAHDTAKSRTTALKLSGWYVVLPWHVGLILRLDGGIWFVSHNKDMKLISATRYEELKNEWVTTEDNGEEVEDTSRPFELHAFLMDVSSRLFIRSVDQPARLRPLPKLSSHKRQLSASLWQRYLRDVVGVRGRLFGVVEVPRGDETFRIDVAYLRLLELERIWFNEAFVPFWNKEAIPAWKQIGSRLVRILSEYKKSRGRTKARAETYFNSVRVTYIDRLLKGNRAGKLVFPKSASSYDRLSDMGLEKLRKEEKDLDLLREAVETALDTFPKIIAKGATRTHHRRVSVGKGLRDEVFEHIKAISAPIDTMIEVPIPPFASEDDKLDPIPQ